MFWQLQSLAVLVSSALDINSRGRLLCACIHCACSGVVGQGVEANIPRPGTVDFPNPSAQLMEKVPIARVTVDGDVTAQSIPDAPGGSQPRN
jgi:hypothetical protein